MQLQQGVPYFCKPNGLACPTGAKPLPENKTQFLRLSNRPVKGRRMSHVARKNERDSPGRNPALPRKYCCHCQAAQQF
jgi:hypothetical protein